MATFESEWSARAKNTTSVSVDVTPTVGNNLIVFLHVWDDGSPSDLNISDDESNSWTEDHQHLSHAGDQKCLIAHLNNVSSYTTPLSITGGKTGGSGSAWFGIVVLEYSGGDFTFEAASTGSDYNSTPATGASITGNDLTLSSVSHSDSNRTITPNSGTGSWTERSEEQNAASGQPHNTLESTSTGTINAEWAFNIMNGWAYGDTVTYSEGGGGADVDLSAIAVTTTMDATSESGEANETLDAILASATLDAVTYDAEGNVVLSDLLASLAMDVSTQVGLASVALAEIALTVTIDTPTVETEVTADVDLLELDTAVFVPTPSVAGNAERAPPAIETTATLDAAAVTGEANVTLTAIAVTAEVPVPTVVASTPVNVSLLELATSIGMDVVSVAGEAAVTSDEITATVDLPQVTVEAGGGVVVNLTAIATSVTMDAATATGDAAPTLTAIAATTDVPAPSVAGEASVTLDSLTSVASLDTAATTGIAAVTSDDLLVTTNIPTWGIAVEAGLQSIAVTSTLETAVATGEAAVTSDEIAVTADLPIVTVQAGGGVNVNLGQIATSVSMDAAAVSGVGAVTTSAIAATATLDTPAVSSGVGVTSDEIAVTTDLPAVTVDAGAGINVNLTAIAATTTMDVVTTTGEAGIALLEIEALASVPFPTVQVPGGAVNVDLTPIHVRVRFWSWDFDVQFGSTLLKITTGGSQVWVYPEAIPGQFILPIATAVGYKDFEASGVGEGTGSGTMYWLGFMVASGVGVGAGRVVTDLQIEFVDPLDTDEVNTSPYNVVVRAFNWKPTVTVVFVVDDELPWAVMGAYFHASGEIRWNYAWMTEAYTSSVDLDTHMFYGGVPTSLDRAGVQPVSGVALDQWTDAITVTKGDIDMVATGTGVGTGYAAMFDTKEFGFATGTGIGLGVGAMFDEIDMYAIGIGVGTGVLYVRFDYQRGVGVSTTAKPPSVRSDTAVPSVTGEEPSSVDADAQQSRVEVDDG